MTRRLLCTAFFLGIGAATVAPGIAGADTAVPANPASGCPGAATFAGPGTITIKDPNAAKTGTIGGTYFQLAPPFVGPVTVTYNEGVEVVVQTGTGPGIGMLAGSYDRLGLPVRCDLIPGMFIQP
ncbi:hypothetical protein IU449_20450 [Nocardia higoensis]|uniref:Uncharacterized protein n=1 Tax=Nocardia higoensis TaxID=228599 RepID=A0ABS0DEP2_9NOCA|nr:hypothetical protein [Nocardia higoensis]MBF6356884.1 hypothetical protein [Nocardia higoensis]